MLVIAALIILVMLVSAGMTHGVSLLGLLIAGALLGAAFDKLFSLFR